MTRLSKTAAQIDSIINTPPLISTPWIRIIGDSIMSQNSNKTLDTDPIDSGTVDTINFYPRMWNIFAQLQGNSLGFEAYLNITDGQRYGSNSGIGGDDWEEILARLPTVLAAMPEKYLFFHAGTNDINGGYTLARIKAAVEACVALCVASGITPIFSTVMGRNVTDGSYWGTTGGTTADQKKLVLSGFNAWLTEYCRNNGYILVDFNAVTSDTDGDLKLGYSSDGLHPNGQGGYYIALELQRTLGSLVPKQRAYRSSAYDVYDATYNPHGNIILNPQFSGTGGTLVSTGYTGTFVGVSGGAATDVPDDWLFTLNSTGKSDVTITRVALPDGRGYGLEILFESDGSGNAARDYRLTVFNGGVDDITTSVGDLIKATAEVQYFEGVEYPSDSKHLIGGLGWYIMGETAVYLQNKTTISFDATTNQIRNSANGFGSFVGGYYVVVKGATNSANNARFYVESATAGVLQLSSDSGIVDEAAGASVSLAHPAQRVTTVSSVEKMPNADTDILYMEAPILETAFGNRLHYARFSIYINEDVPGSNKIRIAWPSVRKLETKPPVLSVLANDD